MFNLLRKDLYIQKKIFIFGFVYVIMMMIIFNDNSSAMLQAGVVAIAFMMLQNSNAYDDKNNADLLFNCLPMSKFEIVLSKYISVFMYYIIGLIYYLIVSLVVVLIANIVSYDINVSLLSIPSVLGALFSVLLINSIYLPIYYKVGYAKSRVINTVVFVTFFMLITSLGKMRSSVLDIESKELSPTIVFLMKSSEIQGLMIIVVLGFGIFALSLFISKKFYEKKEF